LGGAVEPSSTVNCFYLRISGDITNQGDALESWKVAEDTWLPMRTERSQANSSNTVHFCKDIAITKEQFIQFTESPSHHNAFLNELTGHPNYGSTVLTPLMKEIHSKDNKQIRRLFNRRLECEICGSVSGGLRLHLNHACFCNNGNEEDFKNGIIPSVFMQHMLVCNSPACLKAAYERKNAVNVMIMQLVQQHQQVQLEG
jgi:hypothetical protein